MRHHATLSLFTALGIAAFLGCSGAPSSTSGPDAGIVAASGSGWSSSPASKAIDDALARAWTAKGLTPSADVDDATFLRRATLDIVGRIPTVEEARAFLDDGTVDKRARAVDRLIASPEHDRHLARTWETVLLGDEVKERIVDRAAFRRFLERRFAKNAPWDEIVTEIVTAEGRTSLGGERKRGSALLDDPEMGTQEADHGVSGAANYYLRFAKAPQDIAGVTSRAFLGVQIQCAQCHDHKTESWKQADFRSFASAMARVKIEPIDRTKGMMSVFEISNAKRPPRKLLRDDDLRAIFDAPPRALDGTDLTDAPNVREALAKWMTSRENPWFSRAMANRVWAEMMGQGLVEPVDDLREKNPAIVPEVLDVLAEGFEASGFDVDYLYRTIALSQAYSRVVTEGKGSARDDLFARAELRPLGSDVLLDSLFVATDLEHLLEERAPERADLVKAFLRRQMRFVFESDTESNGESYDGTLQQALFSMNGAMPIAATTVAPGTVLSSLVGKDDEAVIEELWLRALSRRPEASEIAEARAFVNGPHPDGGANDEGRPARPRGKERRLVPPAALRSQADDDRERAYEDLFWALLNSSEMNFRR
ncbi:MAG: DUF1549 domain-containing protein [Myxococcales bacterium]|nr:DUF1549 domain-containing protein [Myxococcales bacterium]